MSQSRIPLRLCIAASPIAIETTIVKHLRNSYRFASWILLRRRDSPVADFVANYSFFRSTTSRGQTWWDIPFCWKLDGNAWIKKCRLGRKRESSRNLYRLSISQRHSDASDEEFMNDSIWDPAETSNRHLQRPTIEAYNRETPKEQLQIRPANSFANLRGSPEPALRIIHFSVQQRNEVRHTTGYSFHFLFFQSPSTT